MYSHAIKTNFLVEIQKTFWDALRFLNVFLILHSKLKSWYELKRHTIRVSHKSVITQLYYIATLSSLIKPTFINFWHYDSHKKRPMKGRSVKSTQIKPKILRIEKTSEKQVTEQPLCSRGKSQTDKKQW